MGPLKVMLVLVRTLGDVMLIPVLVDAIKNKFGEDTEVDVFVNLTYLDVVSGNPKITNIFVEDDWLKKWDDILQRATSGYYHEVMIPQQLTREDNIWHQLDHLRHQHLVDFYLSRCRLPRRDGHEKLQIFIPREAWAQADVLVAMSANGYVVLHSSSLVPSKNWDRFRELVVLLQHKGYLVVQVGGSGDPEIGGAQVTDLRGKLSLKEVAAVCGKARCFVGLDSGLSYIAAATGVPTIVLQGATIPETSGPWGENVVHILSTTLPQCQEVRCHGNCRYPKQLEAQNGKCINNISETKVEKAVYEAIEKVQR